MPFTVSPGGLAQLDLEIFDETSGALTDPAALTLDITYGTEVGLVTDTAGPFTYTGSSTPTTGVVYRTGTGLYSFKWLVPSGAASGVYVANWSVTIGADTFLGIENFTVTGGSLPVVTPPSTPPVGSTGPAVDQGYWTGGITYNGLDIEFGGPDTDTDGITWIWQKLEGWDGPDVTGGLLQKSGDQGAWTSPQFFQPRTMTWTVTASAPTQALRDTARSKLSQAIPVSDLALLRYDEPVPKQAQVRRAGKITETYPTLTDVQFSVLLVAPDPRKYATVLKTLTVIGGPQTGITYPVTYPVTFPANAGRNAIACTNGGDFETRPVVTIQGPVVGPSLVNAATGQAVSWSSLILSGSDTLVVDFLNQQAFLNGAFRPADVGSWWWNLAADATTTVVLDSVANTGAVLTVQFSDAYI